MPADHAAPHEFRATEHPPGFACLRIAYAQTVRVFVAGELDVATVPQLDRALRQAAADAPLVILDLRRLEFAAICGAKLLLQADERIRQAGGRLHIAHAPDELHRLLEVVGAMSTLDFEHQQPAPAGPPPAQQTRVG